MNAQDLARLAALISDAEYFKNAYFFTPPYNAACRRSYELKHSHGELTWTDAGHVYTAAFSVNCSCRNVYARGDYTRDGKKTTLTAVRNSYARMAAAQA